MLKVPDLPNQIKADNYWSNIPDLISAVHDPNLTFLDYDKFFSICYKAKAGRAAGLDCIPSEVFKGESLSTLLFKLCSEIWTSKNIPDSWRNAKLVPVPKPKSDGQFRGISLCCSAYKIYASSLLSIILPKVIDYVGLTQFGFLPGRSTSDVIHAVRQISEANINDGTRLHGILIDFSKAFDQVNRSLFVTS
jgi:hypothetical protein